MSGDKDSPKKPSDWRPDNPLGKALRDRYKEVLNEPVPEKLKKLIEEMKKKEERGED
ncbi:MAG: NepR family anti-sigma factor [Henriciella sp.]|nr:NepR family anti-sigma factor [Hyphomonadaceae bacterium]